MTTRRRDRILDVVVPAALVVASMLVLLACAVASIGGGIP